MTQDNNADEFRRWLEKKAKQIEKDDRAWYRVSMKVKDTAVKYAPKSPTRQERKSDSRATKKQWAAASARRSARGTSREKPGGLMRSISSRYGTGFAEIFCAANSEAGAYAYAMHELKGKTWHKRGPGTRAKGSKADDKFITRAIDDNKPAIETILKSHIRTINESE